MSEHLSEPMSHNFSTFQHQNMESDCEDTTSIKLQNKDSSFTSNEILKIRSAISSQMMVGPQDLQNQHCMLTAELQKVVADAEKFKQEMRDELLHL